ncbi:hypothetical protein [Deinococcus sp. NW-56]|uniref:hypothetical protein n=1 Tax=Deinococcus sp. NW-56 TaxID=2080419 RepID=UPI000CF40887|nr:hypothetical protein [Deinococcus sp. NW-56]
MTQIELGTLLTKPGAVELIGKELEARTQGENRPNRVLPPVRYKPHAGELLPVTPGTFDQTTTNAGCDMVYDRQRGLNTIIYGAWNGTVGDNNSGETTIGLAYSDGLSNWAKLPGPILSKNPSSTAIDRGGVTFPQVTYWDGVYYMYYIGFDAPGYDMGDSAICLAVATDVRGPWTRRGQILKGGQQGLPNDRIWRPTVFRVGQTWYMVFNSSNAGTEELWRARAPHPQGPWTVEGRTMPVSAVPWANGTILSDPDVTVSGDLLLLHFWALATSDNAGKIGFATLPIADWLAGRTTWAVYPEPTMEMIFGSPITRPVTFEYDGQRHMLFCGSGTQAGSKETIRLASAAPRIVPVLNAVGRENMYGGVGLFNSAQPLYELRLNRDECGVRRSWQECRLRGRLHVRQFEGYDLAGTRIRITMEGGTPVVDVALKSGQAVVEVDARLRDIATVNPAVYLYAVASPSDSQLIVTQAALRVENL